MTSTFETLLPVFLLIALGWGLRFRQIVPEDMWRGVELLGYWVFFPALLGDTLIRSDISQLPLTGIAVTMIGAFLTMALLLLAARKLIMAQLAIDGPSYSSLFQSATRWNGFIALPVLAKLYGDEGVALVAVIIGALVPIANVTAVYVVAHNASGRELTWRETTYIVFRNPFIWATAIGLLINLTGITIYAPVMTALGTLGGAAIASGLLMVGAGLSTRDAIRPSPAVWLGTSLKLFGTPALVVLWSFATGITGTPFVACIACASVPTAMSAYVLARQMGGDAPLVATTVTMQTIISFFSIPAMIALARVLQ
ncbi:MAG TPA: AEC family transporter [Aestuariivirga sp.]|nr:AEC family transporter [Aestuariivirga sp.]